MAVTALLFLAFAFFAVGQAAATRNSAQTAADAAALAAATETRDGISEEFLKALESADLEALTGFLEGNAMDGIGACDAADAYAEDNKAEVTNCLQADGGPGWTVDVLTLGTVGNSVIPGTEGMRAPATATAVVESDCEVAGPDGDAIKFTCDGTELTVDPTGDDFDLNLAEFFFVHLSE